MTRRLVFAAVVLATGIGCAREHPIDLLSNQPPEGMSRIRLLPQELPPPCHERVQSDGGVGVWFAVVIDTTGAVVGAELLGLTDQDRGRPYACGTETLAALRHWRFESVTVNGKPVSVRTRIGVTLPALPGRKT
jgi:hypothetical protein